MWLFTSDCTTRHESFSLAQIKVIADRDLRRQKNLPVRPDTFKVEAAASSITRYMENPAAPFRVYPQRVALPSSTTARNRDRPVVGEKKKKYPLSVPARKTGRFVGRVPNSGDIRQGSSEQR